MHALDRLVVIPARARELTHRGDVHDVRRLPLLGAALGRDERAEEHRDDRVIEAQPTARALAHGRELHRGERHGDREHEAGEERPQERPAIEPELLADAREERRADEHGAVVHVRLVALERIDLAADEEQRAEHEQDAHGPARHAARARRHREQRRPEHEPDEQADEIEEEVAAREAEQPRMPLREIDADDPERRREEERSTREAA